MSQLSVFCMGRWGIVMGCRPGWLLHLLVLFYAKNIKAMSINITNLGGVVNYHDNHKEITIHNAGNTSEIVRQFMADDIEPVEGESEQVDSIIFTKKAKVEHKESYIIAALQKSVQGRNDKTRALVKELQYWQKDDYIDPNYNAQVMYDELQKIMRLPFGYDAFKRLYNNTRS